MPKVMISISDELLQRVDREVGARGTTRSAFLQQWFHAAGEEEVDKARTLLTAHVNRTVALAVLDLTRYEIGNALLRGPAKAGVGQIAMVLEALGEICPAITPGSEQLRLAAQLAEAHGLTLYDAAYAAVARSRDAALVTLDRELLDAGLGIRPAEMVRTLEDPPEHRPPG